MDSFTIKPVSLDQLDALQRISVNTFVASYGHLNKPDNLQLHLDRNLNLEQLSAEVLHPDMMFFFGFVHDQLAAYSKLNVGQGQTEDYGPDFLEIERIYVLEHYHGNGYGRLLIEHAISQARALNKSSVWLGVWQKNPKAIAFYKHLGFKKTGTHTFTVGGDPQTDWVMQYNL